MRNKETDIDESEKPSSNLQGHSMLSADTDGSGPNGQQDPRYYLGLWLFDLNSSVDFLGCAWRHNGAWFGRTRFRCRTDLLRESRYEVPIIATSEVGVKAHMDEVTRVANVNRKPSRYIPINGDPRSATKIIFSDSNLAERAMDDLAIPVLYGHDGIKFAQILLSYRNTIRGPAPNVVELAELKEILAKRAIIQERKPNGLTSWTLDLIGLFPA